jgi:hypothetical protein
MKKKPTPCWISFICHDGSIPAVLEAKNHGGGIYKGMAFESWAFDGEYFAIWNMAGNAVWCHKKNFKLLSRGTVYGLPKIAKFVDDWRGLKSQTNKALNDRLNKQFGERK